MKVNERMVWIELASGPGPESDRVANVTCVITDKELEEIARTSNDVGEDAREAQKATLDLVRAHLGKGAGLLAGRNVQEVRLYLAEHMPELFEHLHYRNVDLSTVRHLVQSWYPEAFAGRPTGEEGIASDLAELRYYRSTVFAVVPEPEAGGEAGPGETADA